MGAHWAISEMEGADLGDERLNRRLCGLLKALGDKPTLSIPGACEAWKETLAAYRFCDNEKVSPEKILAPHRAKTLERMREHPVVLMLQDTTEIDLNHRKVAGAGPLSYEERTGLFVHTTLAVTPERLCLGVLDAKIWGRNPEDFGKAKRRKKVPIEAKESFRWLEGYRSICEAQAGLGKTQLISVGDRENDIFEFLSEGHLCREKGLAAANFIVRSARNRSLSKTSKTDAGYKKIWDELEARPALGKVSFEVPETKDRKNREVEQTVRSGSFTLHPPHRLGEERAPEITIQAVLLREETPPKDETPLEWILLTDLPVETFEAACQIVQYYLSRWEIEMFFKTLKSGCGVEELYFKDAKRLECCLALYLVVGWRVLFAMRLGRECPDLPCDAIFEEAEWKAAMKVSRPAAPIPTNAPPLGEFMKVVARFGGYLNRKSDPPPGTKAIWIGLQRIADFALAYKSIFSSEEKRCV